MARTYSSTPVLSKIKIGNSTYYLKDADARAILDGIDADVYESLKLALGTVAGGGNNLVTAGAIKSYVDEIAELGFDVIKLNELPTADAQAYADYHNRIVLIEDASSVTGGCVEYIIMRSGTEGSYTYAWEKIGTTKVDLSGYLKDINYVDATHTLTKTKNENGVDVTTNVHTFGDFADADTGTWEVSDYVVGVSYASVTATGSIDTFSVYDASTGSLPSFSEGAFDAGSLPSFTEGSFSAGALPSFSEGAFNAGALPSLSTETRSLYKQGIKAEVGSGVDAETLIFTNVDKEADIAVVTSWDAGSLPSKAADTWDAGSLPSKAADSWDAGSLPSKVADTWDAGSFPTTKSQSVSFHGDQVNVNISLATDSKTVTVNPDLA